jgi:hypothetical protein
MSVDRDADPERQPSVDEPPTTPDDGNELPLLFVPAAELYHPATEVRVVHPAHQASDEAVRQALTEVGQR